MFVDARSFIASDEDVQGDTVYLGYSHLENAKSLHMIVKRSTSGTITAYTYAVTSGDYVAFWNNRLAHTYVRYHELNIDFRH